MPEVIDVPGAPRAAGAAPPQQPLAAEATGPPAVAQAAAPPVTAPSAAPGSLAARLQAGFAPVLAQSVKEFDVPGWVAPDGRPTLRARVGVIADQDDIAATAEAADSNAAFIARATRGLLLRGEDGTFEPVVGDDGQPVRFDLSFARLMGWAATSASGVVQQAVGPHEPGEINPLAIGTFADTILAWMRGERSGAAEQLRPT